MGILEWLGGVLASWRGGMPQSMDDDMARGRSRVQDKYVAHRTMNGEPLNPLTSIVDLLKLYGRDASKPARNKVASEVGFTGRVDGSSESNTALLALIIRKIGSGEFS